MPDVYDDSKVTYYDDVNVGDEFISMARTITEADLVNFGALIGWYDPLHCDAVFAESTLFKQRVASGLLGLALSNGLCRGCFSTGLGRGANMAFVDLEWSFKKPIFIGDTIHVCQNISKKKELKKSDRGIIVLDVTVVNQNGEVVQEGTKTFMIRRRV